MGTELSGKARRKEKKMRSSLVLLVSLALLLSLFLPAIEAAAARRRGKGRAGRRGVVSHRGRQQGRRGRARVQARRGRQDTDVAADANAVDGEAEEEIYNGCDPATNIGGFLIQKLWRKKCVELEYTNFGGYGGIPAEEEEEEEEGAEE